MSQSIEVMRAELAWLRRAAKRLCDEIDRAEKSGVALPAEVVIEAYVVRDTIEATAPRQDKVAPTTPESRAV